VIVAALLVAGCSSSAKQPTPVAANGTTASATTPEGTSPSVTESPSTSGPTPGTVVLDQSMLATVCNPLQADSTVDANGTNPDGTSPTASVAGSITSVLPGGIAILACGTEVAGYDLRAGQILWQKSFGTDPNASGDDAAKITVVYATQHIYELETDTVPADGLIAAYTTAHITAYNARSGEIAWSRPLEPGNKKIDISDAKVIEIPAKADGRLDTIVSLGGANIGDAVGLDIGLDSATGASLWHREPLVAEVSYLGDNIALQVEVSDPIVLTALDTATGRQAWRQTYPTADLVIAGNTPTQPELIGHTIWFFGTTGYDTFDLTTGSHTAHVLYPVSFQHVLSTTSLTMAYVDNSLRLFHLGKWSKPLWSVTSDDATPLLVSDTVNLVSAAGGLQVLSTDAGRVETSSLTAEDVGSDQFTVLDGFAFNTTTVIAVAPTT
jgi:outer membrane protein assembly factor BamB